MNDVELARWQGKIDERTARADYRLDAINGDLVTIRDSLGRLEALAQEGVKEREEYLPVLKGLATSASIAEGVTARLKEHRAFGLTRLQAYVGGAGFLLVCASFTLRLLGISGF